MHDHCQRPARTTAGAARRPHESRGFTLLELLLVIVLIGFIASVVVPRIGLAGSSAKAHMCDQFTSDLNAAAEKYYFANGTAPDSVHDLQGDNYYGPDLPTCPVNGTPYQINPATGRLTPHGH